jgi:alpha-1,3-glucosyltransferase
MLVLENLNYASPQTVLYQRATVVATELVLVFAVAHYFRSTHFRAIFFAQSSARDASTAGMVLAVINAGLFITDHVHFQYNAMLLVPRPLYQAARLA